jgi:hypothetical protein
MLIGIYISHGIIPRVSVDIDKEIQR